MIEALFAAYTNRKGEYEATWIWLVLGSNRDFADGAVPNLKCGGSSC
jgi:hypothetical protein